VSDKRTEILLVQNQLDLTGGWMVFSRRAGFLGVDHVELSMWSKPINFPSSITRLDFDTGILSYAKYK